MKDLLDIISYLGGLAVGVALLGFATMAIVVSIIRTIEMMRNDSE